MMYNVLHPWVAEIYSVLIYTDYFISELSLSPDIQGDYHYSGLFITFLQLAVTLNKLWL
ncbi:MAG: hypothetical protein V7K67_25660 [Nostoc sp.]|uniref:hypothetical protein n=1 Tax=Nostoc sp. TaxID=1180 RepID=UPI002FFD508C